jgi:hypothetical protein
LAVKTHTTSWSSVDLALVDTGEFTILAVWQTVVICFSIHPHPGQDHDEADI